jgi:serine protease Do
MKGLRKHSTFKLFSIAVAVLVAFQLLLVFGGVSNHAIVYADDYRVIFKEVEVADVVEAAQPSVVLVKVTYKTPERKTTYTQEDVFRQFFNDGFFFPFPEDTPSTSTATGFIISEDGYILTNQHVIDQSYSIERIEVTMLGYDTPATATLIGQDYVLDLAILKVDVPGKLPALKLGDSDTVRIGETVVAIGNPYGYEHTVTKGVLSAKGREIAIPDTTRGVTRTYNNLMQTDAAINPGNSGGPLLNARGEVIGINTAVSLQAQGIGFAIPINTAKNVIDQLISRGKVLRPYVGIMFSNVPDTLIEYYGLRDKNGVCIERVEADSPAEKAGLRVGDIIRKISDKKEDIVIKDTDHFVNVISSLKVGEKYLFTILRNGRTDFVTVTLGERPADY